MAASFAWLSFSVRRRSTVIVSRKILKCEWSSTYGEILEKLDPQFVDVPVEKVVLCSNEQFKDPVHVAPLNAPIELCQSYGFNLCYYLEDGEPMIAMSCPQEECLHSCSVTEEVKWSVKQLKWPKEQP